MGKRDEEDMQVRMGVERKARSGSHDVVRNNAKPYGFAFLTSALSPNTPRNFHSTTPWTE
jgi:hypothetical protein